MMNAQNNLSCVLHKKDDLRLENRCIPRPGPHEVQVKMAAVGICGSDVHFWQDGTMFGCDVTEPLILGHESSGVVSGVGPNVTHLKPGDRVAIEPGYGCRRCPLCKQGRYNLCPDEQFRSSPPTDGTLAQYIVHPADFVYKLPDHVSLEEGALLEPLNVAVAICHRAAISGGHRVLICGSGSIGLITMLTAKAFGATKVIITDISASRLEFAKELGADFVINVRDKQPEKVAAEIAALLGDAPDVSVECSGAEQGLQTAIYATKPAGVMMMVGMGPLSVKVPLLTAMVREVDIRGIFRYANQYPAALELLSSGRVENISRLVTHRFKLQEAKEAFVRAKAGPNSEGTIKVMISCNDDVS